MSSRRSENACSDRLRPPLWPQGENNYSRARLSSSVVKAIDRFTSFFFASTTIRSRVRCPLLRC